MPLTFTTTTFRIRLHSLARQPLALLLAGLLAAPLAGHADTPLPVHPDLRSGRLANGMGWSVLPNAHPKGQIHLWLTVDAGSMDEADDEQGYAHFVEHMLFNGTRRYPGTSLVTRLETLGLRFGRDSNALTGPHQTRYMLTLPDGDPARLAEAMDIFREWAAHARFDPDEVIRERGVIEAEWRANQGPGQRLSPRLMGAMLPGSAYPERLPIGRMEQVRSAEAPRLKAFYERWYAPGNMHFIAVGDFDPQTIQGLIETTLGSLPGRPFPERAARLRPVHDGTRQLALSDPERGAAAVTLVQRQPRLALTSEEALWTHAMESLAVRLAGQRSQARQQGRQPGINLQLAPLPDGSRMLQARLPMAAGRSPEDAARQLIAELSDLDGVGFTRDELRPQRDLLLASLEKVASSATPIDSRLLMQGLDKARSNGEPFLSPAQHKAVLARPLLMLDPDEVSAAWQHMRAGSERLVIWEGKDLSAPPLDAESFARLEESVRPAATPAARNEPDLRMLRLMNPPKAGSITASAPLDGIPGGEAWKLSNGLEVMVIPDARSPDTVTLGMHSPRGLLHLSDGSHTLAPLAFSWLERRTANMAPEPFARWKVQHRIGLRAATASLGSQLILSAPLDHLEDAFQVLHMQLTRPRPAVPPAALGATRAALQEMARNPAFQLQEAARKALLDDARSAALDPGTIMWLADNLRARDIVRDLLAPTREIRVILLTPSRPEALRPFVETYLANLPPREADRPVARPLKRNARPAEIRLPGGQPERTEVLLSLYGPVADASPETELAVQALMHELGVRLRNELRETLGATYAVGTSVAIDGVDNWLLGHIRFTCAPEREEELVRRARDALQDLLARGLDADAIERFQRQRRTTENQMMASDEAHIAALLRSYRQDGDLLRPQRTAAALERMDPASVNGRIQALAARLQVHKATMLPRPNPASP